MDSYLKRQTFRAIESLIRDYLEYDDIWDDDVSSFFLLKFLSRR